MKSQSIQIQRERMTCTCVMAFFISLHNTYFIAFRSILFCSLFIRNEFQSLLRFVLNAVYLMMLLSSVWFPHFFSFWEKENFAKIRSCWKKLHLCVLSVTERCRSYKKVQIYIPINIFNIHVLCTAVCCYISPCAIVIPYILFPM